jgi:hypothetical protein
LLDSSNSSAAESGSFGPIRLKAWSNEDHQYESSNYQTRAERRSRGKPKSFSLVKPSRAGQCRARHPRTGLFFCTSKACKGDLCMLHSSKLHVLQELSDDQMRICREQQRYANQMHKRVLEVQQQQQQAAMEDEEQQWHWTEQPVGNNTRVYPSRTRQQTRPRQPVMENMALGSDDDVEGEDLYADNAEDREEELAELAQMELEELEDDSFVVPDDDNDVADMDDDEEEEECEEEEDENILIMMD